jgi:hypothetical protein
MSMSIGLPIETLQHDTLVTELQLSVDHTLGERHRDQKKANKQPENKSFQHYNPLIFSQLPRPVAYEIFRVSRPF